jgi:hypothetical protein
MDECIAFNARAVYAFKSDCLYRIHLTVNDAYFLRLGGQNWAAGHAIGHQFGLLGILLVMFLQQRSERKQAEKAKLWEDCSFEELLENHRNNFRAAPEDFLEAAIEPASFWQGHGAHVGRWAIQLKEQGKMVLQFENLEDMQKAMRVLPAWLGPTLRVNVVWNESKKRFDKKPADALDVEPA